MLLPGKAGGTAAVRRTLASTICRIADPTLVARPRQLRDASAPSAGIKRQILSTLMSAFASSGQINSWLSFKHLLQALPSKAGGTAVMTTVDHTLMRGSEPHDR